jgi:hypothetical protein
VRQALVDGGERPALVEVGRVHGVAGATQLVREGRETFRLTQRVVEQQHLRHLASLAIGCDRMIHYPRSIQ